MGQVRIAIVSSSAGALVNFRGPLIIELVSRGLAVAALAPDFTPALKKRIEAMGAHPVDYRLERTGTSLGKDARSFADLVTQFRRERPDLVLSHFMKPVIYGTLAARIARVPKRYAMIEGLGYAFTDTGGRSAGKAILQKVMQALLWAALRFATRVIFLNEDDRKDFVSGRIAPADRSVVLGGIGLDLSDFPFSRPALAGPVVFTMVARVIREKGVLEYVEAARRTRAHFPSARFVLVGGLDAKTGSLSREEIEQWVADGLIEWTDEVEDVRPYLRDATIFVLPSYREGVPRSTQEAMATGRAVITTDVPGCRATIEPGINGLIVPPRDPEALALAMIALASNRGQVEAMGVESRRLAEEHFDVNRVNARLISFLDLADNGASQSDDFQQSTASRHNVPSRSI